MRFNFTKNDFIKIFEYADTRIRQKLHEQKFGKRYPIKYLLYENDSPYLGVVFSSCTRVGIKARYNYVRTLEPFKINKLFILDEYSDDGRGCYYLGHNRDFSICDNTFKLIRYIEQKESITETIYCGSSKGGWAALFFGLGGVRIRILLQVRLNIY